MHDILQMAGIAATSELNDRQRFRSFFRTEPSHEFIGAALAEIARQFNWTQMAILSQDDSLFLTVCQVLLCWFLSVFVIIQIADSLDDILKSEGRELDKSIIIPDSSQEVFPYEKLHTLVSCPQR